MQPEGCLHIAFVRSTLAHARIRSLDVEAAAAAPGVVAVLTGAALGLPDRVGFPMVAAAMARAPLARERVRCVGEAVALVVAESSGQAADAAQLIDLDLEPLPVLVDPELARRPDAPLLFAEHGSNIAGHFDSTREEDVLAGAEVKIRGRFVNQRLAPVPMEPEAILVVPEGGRLLVRATSQVPFGLRAEMASSLGLSPADIRVVVGDMGGGVGAKAGARAELIVVAAAARKRGRRLRQWPSGRWTCWRPSLRWTRPNCGAAPSSRAIASPTPPPAGPHTTPVTTRRRSTRCSRCRRIESCARSRQSDARAETATSWASACRSMSRSPRWVSALNGVRFTSRLTEQQPCDAAPLPSVR